MAAIAPTVEMGAENMPCAVFDMSSRVKATAVAASCIGTESRCLTITPSTEELRAVGVIGVRRDA